PPQLGVPVICSVAESVPDEIVPFAAICCDVEPKFCCVVSDPPQPPSWLRVKSNSVAVGLAEDRVSGATVLKHEGVVPPWPWNASVMSIPPSKKSGDPTVLPTLEPFAVSQSVVTLWFQGKLQGGLGSDAFLGGGQKALVVAQSESVPLAVLQSAPVAIGRLLQPCVPLTTTAGLKLSLESMQPASP